MFGVATSIIGVCILFVTKNSLWWLAFIIYMASNTTYGAAYVFYYAWVPILTRFDQAVIDSEQDEKLTDEERYTISDMVSNEISGKGFFYSYITAVCELIVAAGIAMFLGSGENYGLTAAYPLQIGVALASIWQLAVLLGYTNRHLKARPGPPLPEGESYLSYSFKNLWYSLSDAAKIGELFKFLIGWFIYSDSFSTVSSVAILYGQTQLKASTTILLVSAIIVPLMAGVGNVVWLKIQKRFNMHSKQVLLIQAGLYSLLPLYGLLGFFTPKGSFGLQSTWEIPVLGMYHGFLLGATQSTCRVLFSELLPRGHESEFFGLYGPLIVGLITQLSGNMRYAFVFLFIIFFIPIYIFSTIDLSEMLGNQSQTETSALAELQQRYKLNISESDMKKLLQTNDLSNFLSPEINFSDILNTKPRASVTYQQPDRPPPEPVKVEEGDLSEYYYTFIEKSKHFVFGEIKPKYIQNDYKLYNEINSKLEFTEIVDFEGPFEL
ncbi:Autophagy protein 22 [Terramyces sp. JEL0728]|nr:Autophagy protein 22 [Terramyces sp. JEL0728]